MGLGAPMRGKIYIIISIFYKCMQTIKLRQTNENNRGPSTSKSDAKVYLERQKATPKWS